MMTNGLAAGKERVSEIWLVAERLAPLRHLFRLRADQAAAGRARLDEVVDEGHEARDASPARIHDLGAGFRLI